jgi:5,10-methenyltetrahydromethanopterin hydrogenase
MKKIAAHEMAEDIPDSIAAAGEYVYVPVYSSIYYRDSTKVYNLTVTLGIRNTDTANDIFIKEINYNNSQGENVMKFLKKPVRVKPLETFDLVIAEDDTTGGIGANFIVKWISKSPVQSPIIEAVMISIRQGVGISFVEQGRVIKKVR